MVEIKRQKQTPLVKKKLQIKIAPLKFQSRVVFLNKYMGTLFTLTDRFGEKKMKPNKIYILKA